MINQMDYVELGLACAEVCAALHRGLNRKKLDDLNSFVRGNRAADDVSYTSHVHFEYLFDDIFGLISGLWRIFKGGSPSRGNEMRFLDTSTRRTTRKKSQPGGWTSSGSFVSSTCVPSLLYGYR